MNVNVSSLLVAAVAALLSSGPIAPASGSAGPAAESSGVCTGKPGCHRAATVDIDGDGRADRVAWRRTDRHHVRFMVRTAGRGRLHRTILVRRPFPAGSVDATRVNGRPGAELVIGPLTRADSQTYALLTYRHGRLVLERPPQERRRWSVTDGSVRWAGWHRRVWPAGRVTMTLKIARRDGDSVRLRGRDIRYEWRGHDWRRARTTRTHRTIREAERIAGWHVGSLQPM